MDDKLTVKIKRLHPDAIIPRYATAGSSGFDLHTIDEGVLLPGERALLRTGLAFEIPPGYEMQIRPRSGLAFKHGISVVNSPGTIDSDYRGDVGVILINHGHHPFRIEKGDRIAQAVIQRVPDVELIEVDADESLSETERGEGGFGSTGIRGEG